MATTLNTNVIVVDVKSGKAGSEPSIATRLKSRAPPVRGLASPEKPLAALASARIAKVASAFNQRVQTVLLSRGQDQVAKREKLEARLQRGKTLADLFLEERKSKATKVVAKHAEVVSKGEAGIALLKEKIDARLSAAGEKRANVVEQIASRASQHSVLVNERSASVKARDELRATELSDRLNKDILAAEGNRRKTLEAVRAKASVNGAGIPYSEAVERARSFDEEKKTELDSRLTSKLETANKKHEEHLEAIRAKAAQVNARAASVYEAQSSAQASSPDKLMGKIQDSLEAADCKRQEIMDEVRSKAAAVVERHTQVVIKHKELRQLQAKTAMLKIEVKLAAADSRRAALSPTKLSPRGTSPRAKAPRSPLAFA